MYGVCAFTGIVLACLYVIFETKKRGFPWENVTIIAPVTLICGLVGAKILYLLKAYSLAGIAELFTSFDGLYTLVSTGTVFYGGLIGGVVGCFWGLRLANAKWKDYEAPFITALPLAHAIGRIGCFCAGCCYGIPTDSVLGVVYTNPVGGAPAGVSLLPVQLFESLFNLLLFLTLHIIGKKIGNRRLLLPIYLVSYAFARFLLEYIRYDSDRGFYFGLSTSQWFSVLAAAAGVILFIIRNQKRKSAIDKPA